MSVLPPESPALARILDPRRAQPLRPIAALLTEIRELETLYAASATGSTDRIATMLRLGDDHTALARAYLAESKPTTPRIRGRGPSRTT